MIPFDDWRSIYEPLYGTLADRALYDIHSAVSGASGPVDYCAAVPATARRVLGEFYTPDWLVQRVLEVGGYAGERMLDPACGAGAFLQRAGARATGWDINPLAIEMARRACPEARLAVCDAFAAPHEDFEFIAGNPPWVNWRHLSALYRERVAPLWKEYGLFTQKGLKARLGGAMDDLSSLMTYVCAERHLVTGGRLAFLLPAAIFQAAGGGEGFRRFALPGGMFLRVVRVEEVAEQNLFEGAMTRPAIAVFEKSRTATVYPVPYVRGGEECHARPVAADPASPWSIIRSADAAAVPSWLNSAEPQAEPHYRARIGAHAGGAAGVYWVDIVEDRGATLLIRNRACAGRNVFPEVTAEVERDLVRPLVRGRDLKDGRARPSAHIVMPYGPEGKVLSEHGMRAGFPLTFRYFENFRDALLARAHYRQHFAKGAKPYWSMFNVGPYTFAPHRVAWREQSAKFQCALLEAGHIADAKLITVACGSAEEARYLLDFLSSDEVRAFVDSYVLKTQISTHVMKYVRVPPFTGRPPSSYSGTK